MATEEQEIALRQRLRALEPNDLDAAIALYGECVDAFGVTDGRAKVPEEILTTFLRKFEDPEAFVTQAADLVKERSS